MGIKLMLIIVAAAFVLKIVDGYKKGMVKEIVSLVSLIVLCLVVALIGGGVHSYMSGKIVSVIVIVILLALVGIAHHLLNVVFFPAKLVAKLPIISSVDKLLGIVFGALEVVLLLWTLYTFIMMMDLGIIEEVLLSYTRESKILAWFYQHNFLAYWIENLIGDFAAML